MIQPLVLVFLCVFLLEGCEPLRKKFIRSKREDATNNKTKVVLEPEDYSPENYTAEEKYVKQYNLWVIWGKSLEEALVESENEKRHRYFMANGLKALKEMSLYLKEEKRVVLEVIILEFEKINEEILKPHGFWNKGSIVRRVKNHSIKLRTAFNPKDLQGYFNDE